MGSGASDSDDEPTMQMEAVILDDGDSNVSAEDALDALGGGEQSDEQAQADSRFKEDALTRR